MELSWKLPACWFSLTMLQALGEKSHQWCDQILDPAFNNTNLPVKIVQDASVAWLFQEQPNTCSWNLKPWEGRVVWNCKPGQSLWLGKSQGPVVEPTDAALNGCVIKVPTKYLYTPHRCNSLLALCWKQRLTVHQCWNTLEYSLEWDVYIIWWKARHHRSVEYLFY